MDDGDEMRNDAEYARQSSPVECLLAPQHHRRVKEAVEVLADVLVAAAAAVVVGCP